jgi:hypothetical protein
LRGLLLVLGLSGGRRSGRLPGLAKVLKTEKDNESQKGHRQQAAHIAAAAAAAARPG